MATYFRFGKGHFASLGTFCVLLYLLIFCPTAFATTTLTWDGGGDGSSWSDASNWNPDSTPNDTHDVVIDSTVAVTIGSGVHAVCASLVLGQVDGSVTPILSFVIDTTASLITSTASGGTGDVTIFDGATLESQRSSNAGEGAGRVFNFAGDLDVQAGGLISADGMGNTANYQSYYPAGSHGGLGGHESNLVTYGSFTNPSSLGESGYDGATRPGGGAIGLVVGGSLTINGTISANAPDHTSNPVGAGGSVNITAASIFGSGTIRANGGSSTNSSTRDKAGGGGRIAFSIAGSDAFQGAIEVNPGTTSRFAGHAGTVYLSAQKRANLVLGGAGNISTLRLGSDGTNSYTFGTITIQSGGTLEIDGNPAVNSPNGSAAVINATSIDIQAGGTLSAEGLGLDRQPDYYEGGGTHGGHGGIRYDTPTYGSMTNPTTLGQGGNGSTRPGGGALILNVSGTLNVDGTLTADGLDVPSYAAGAGGSVNITADTLTGSGRISANGGHGTHTGTYGRGGGGGRIAFNVPNDSFTGAIEANGGDGYNGSRRGHAGTIYLSQSRRNNLVIGGAGNLSTLRLGTDGTNDYTFGTITIQSGGTLEIDSSLMINNPIGSAVLVNAGSLDVQSGGSIRADYFGRINHGNTSYGGSYGGLGGQVVSSTTYGSLTDPVSLGEGGGQGDDIGGGAIRLNISGTFNMDGAISANGADAGSNYHTGAAGGSVNITADTLTGSGTISVNGGAGLSGYGRGSGGGGRIAVRLTSGTSFDSLVFEAFGGDASGAATLNGAAGTVYLQDANDSADSGELIIDNNNLATGSEAATLISFGMTDLAVGDVTIRNAGKIAMSSSVTLDVAGNWTNSGTQTLSDGIVRFDATGAQTIDSGNQSFASLTFDDGGAATGVWTFAPSPLEVDRVLTIVSGTLSIGTQDLTINDSADTGTALSIGANGALTNASTGDLVLGGDVSNSGSISFDAPGTSNDISITSTNGTEQRNWQGSGTFSLTDVAVQDQTVVGGTPAFLLAFTGTDNGNNVNWVFDLAPVANNISPSAFNEDTESIITLSYTDPESDQADSCTIGNLNNITVSTACACAAGTCSVGVTGASNYHGAASFTYTVTANSQPSNSATASLSISSVTDYYTISGTIQEDGSPLQGTEVSLNLNGTVQNAVTGASGQYSFANCAEGLSYQVSFSKANYNFSPISRSGTVSADVDDLIVAVLGTFTISGTIEHEGQPLSGVVLDGGSLGTATSNANGYFEFSGLTKDTSYSIKPGKQSYVFSPKRASGIVVGNSALSFEATEFGNRGVIISGYVRQNGRPIIGALVYILRKLGVLTLEADAKPLRAITDENGFYSISGVTEGDWTVVAEKEQLVVGQYDVSVAEDTVEAPSGSGNGMGTIEAEDVEVLNKELFNPVFTLWNGYRDMINVLELVNYGQEELQVDIELYGPTDSASEGRKLLSVKRVGIEAKKQADVIINDMPEFSADSYGLVKLSFSNSAFSGRMSYYKTTAESASDYDYNYSVPLLNPVQSESFVLFNTYNASKHPEEQGEIVENWLTLGNPSNATKRFDVMFYSLDGSVLGESQAVAVGPYGRVDVEAGHDRFGQRQTGLVRIIPRDPDAPYVSALNRYGAKGFDDYSYAFLFPGAYGDLAKTVLPVEHLPNAFNVVEIGNVTNRRTTLKLALFNHLGEEVFTESLTLRPYAQSHFSIASALPLNSAGVLRITPDEESPILSSSVVYHFRAVDGTLAGAQHSITHHGLGLEHFGSYNLFLGMANWLRMINTSNENTQVTLTINPQTPNEVVLNIPIRSMGRHDLDLHALQATAIAPNSYGPIVLSTSEPGVIVAELLRVKTAEDSSIDFASVSPLQ